MSRNDSLVEADATDCCWIHRPRSSIRSSAAAMARSARAPAASAAFRLESCRSSLNGPPPNTFAHI